MKQEAEDHPPPKGCGPITGDPPAKLKIRIKNETCAKAEDEDDTKALGVKAEESAENKDESACKQRGNKIPSKGKLKIHTLAHEDHEVDCDECNEEFMLRNTPEDSADAHAKKLAHQDAAIKPLTWDPGKHQGAAAAARSAAAAVKKESAAVEVNEDGHAAGATTARILAGNPMLRQDLPLDTDILSPLWSIKIFVRPRNKL